MFTRKIGRFFVVILILIGVLWLGNTDIKNLSNDSGLNDRPIQMVKSRFSGFLDTFSDRTDHNVDFSNVLGGRDINEILKDFKVEDLPLPDFNKHVEVVENETNLDFKDISNKIFNFLEKAKTKYDAQLEYMAEVHGDKKIETPEQIQNKEDLEKLISEIRVSKEINNDTYNRDDYEKPSKSYEYEGKKLSRNDYAWITSDYLMKKEPFKYKCPYTGIEITDEARLDYDHIIALSYVDKYGGTNWTKEQKNEYSYNQNIGVDVWYRANRQKTDKGPSEWLPDINIADYCYSWLIIAKENNIALKQDDINICKLQCLNAIKSNKQLKRIN